MSINPPHIDRKLLAGFLRGLTPEPIITVSEWADRHRYLPPSSARPGKFKMAVTPFNREISDRLSITDPTQIIIFEKSSQVGATETGNNWLGYVIDNAPSSFLYVMPTDALMKKTSKTRIQPMIDTTPALKRKVMATKSRESGNTIQEKYFEGGAVTMIGANSPVGLASTPVRFVYMDEIDRYPLNVGGEGSAYGLARTRTLTYGSAKKIFLTSTPTLDGTSAIHNEFIKTGQRYYHVACPFCYTLQPLIFERLLYRDMQEPVYQCCECNGLIQERYKTWMMDEERAKWVPKFPENEVGVEKLYMKGYHINAMYSPLGMYSWQEMVFDFETAQKDINELIVFTNTKLGLCYKAEEGEKPDWENLYHRSHNELLRYEANRPKAGVVFITAGVDIQSDRIEIMITGWMKGKISQQIDYRVLYGETDGPKVWEELKKIVNEVWVREDNYELPLRYMCVDSGHRQSYVFDFVNNYNTSKVAAIKGFDKLNAIFTPPKPIQYSRAGKKIGTGKQFNIGVSHIKTELYGYFKQRIDTETGEIPHGYCYFLPKEENFFRGLVAEEYRKIINKKGYIVFEWHKKYDRNEPLDTMVYSRAAAAIVGMDRWNDARWERELLESGVPVQHKQETEQLMAQKKEKKRSPFWDQ